MKPKVNDRVIVNHKSDINPKTGIVRVVSAPAKETQVTKVYSDNAVEVVSGDLWKVEQYGGHWVTVHDQQRC